MRQRLGAIIMAVLAALPAAAQTICEPGRGTPLVVSGLAAEESARVQAEPDVGSPTLTRLRERARGVTATGRVRFTDDACAAACAARRFDREVALRVNSECRQRSKIWFEVTLADGTRGWMLSRFLGFEGVSIIPPEPPGAGGGGGGDRPPQGKFRFACRNGERLAVTIRRRPDEAEVVLRAGDVLYLARRSGGPPINYASPRFGGMALSGTVDRVEWKGPGQRATVCRRP
jgi:hypothetical protein